MERQTPKALRLEEALRQALTAPSNSNLTSKRQKQDNIFIDDGGNEFLIDPTLDHEIQPPRALDDGESDDTDTATATGNERSRVRLPLPPQGIIELGIAFPVFQIVMRGEIPSQDECARFRRRVATSIARNRPLPIPSETMNPFFYRVTGALDEVKKEISNAQDEPDLWQPLRTAGDVGLFDEDTADNGNNITSIISKVAYFRLHDNPITHHASILRQGSIGTTSDQASPKFKLSNMKRAYQYNLFKWATNALQSLVEVYTFTTFCTFTKADRKSIFDSLWAANPELLAQQMHAKLTKAVDFHGIFAQGAVDESVRAKWREFLRLKFCLACELFWTYSINVDPTLESKYRQHMFNEVWKRWPHSQG